jgi:hypothetical protein
MAEVAAPWTPEQATSDAVSKKQLVEFLQTNSSSEVVLYFEI